jgi:hypothetical protein
MDYMPSQFERDTLWKIIITLNKEHHFIKNGGYSDPVALATSASALNALVSMIRVNIRAQEVSNRLDVAIDQMTMTEREDPGE